MSGSGALSVAPAPPAPSAQAARGGALTRTRPGERAGAVRGIAVRADVSCGFAGVLLAWTFAAGLLPQTNPGLGAATYWSAGAAAALLVLLSLMIDDVVRVIAARRRGIEVAEIRLSLVGRGADAIGAVRDASDVAVLSAAAPLMSLAMMAMAVVAHVGLVETAGPGLMASVAALVAVANLAIALLDAVRAVPLVLRAWLAMGSRRPRAATRVATRAGRRLGEVLLAIAVVASVSGLVAVAIWAALLGLVLREA